MRVTRNLVVMLVGIMLATLFTTAPAGAIVIKPTVSGFSSSTTTLYKTGGTITLSATVANATSCVFTSNKTITGMPYGITPCNGLVSHDVTLPVNAGKHSVVYTLKFSATGARTTNAKPTIKVTVGTQLPPPSQSAPVAGTVSTTGSATFTDQLNASGGYGTVIYATTVPNSGLSVSSTGAVSTTGALAAGDYTASGTVTDALLAGGTWTYTLTVNEEPSGVLAISVGESHTCTLMYVGTVKCWGWNAYGQLGNGSNTDSSIPVTVSGLSGVVAISAGGAYTCALASGGTVQCWGSNYYGELGNGSNTDSNIPVTVSGLSGVLAISAGFDHTCALTSSGTVQCWGSNGSGQLGNGSNTDSNIPVTVSGLSGVVAVTAGWTHSCALMTGGAVQCWGSNHFGQLGNGNKFNSTTPIATYALTGAVAISAGADHSCALMSDTTVWCWGYNGDGELGDGTTSGANTPVEVKGLSGVASIAAGYWHTCVTVSTGAAQCWGSNESSGLGHESVSGSVTCMGTIACSTTPVLVNGVEGAAAISAGFADSCVLLTDTTVQCWGNNAYGQLGNGTNADSFVPATVSGL